MRAAIQAVAPGARERTDYFQMPGYSYPGFDYEGSRIPVTLVKKLVKASLKTMRDKKR